MIPSPRLTDWMDDALARWIVQGLAEAEAYANERTEA